MVKVISETKQEYAGQTYYRCGHYFQHRGVRLHRKVWEDANGEIPEGFHVHHVDGDTSNNRLDNLKLVPGPKHSSLHNSAPELLPRQRRQIEKIRPKASAWHRSPEGRAWHGEQSSRTWKTKKAIQYKCSYCGCIFDSRYSYSPSSNRFCCNNHKAAYRRLMENGKSRCGSVYREIGCLQPGS
jgi:hypothetical protein